MKFDNRPVMAAVIGCAVMASPVTARAADGDAAENAPSASAADTAALGAAAATLPLTQTLSVRRPDAYPASANGDGNVTGGYATARWSEDWRGYSEASRRDDIFDRLKYLPITGDGDVYLTLSGELRLRSIYTSNPDLVEGEHRRQDVLRLAGGADLHIGRHLRFYGELAHADSGGHNVGTLSSLQDNDLAVVQSFAEATGRVGNVSLGARYGRQMFYDGSKMLVSQRDNNAIHFTQNGLRLWARGEALRIDLFDFRPTSYGREGTDDDRSSRNIRFSGVTLGSVLPRSITGDANINVDPFFWRLRRRSAAWVGTEGREERYYLGAHVWGDAGPVAFDWTANHQFGRFDGRPIRAWQVFLDQSVALSPAKGAPRVGLSFDYASGGGGEEDGTGTLANAITPHGANTPFSHNLFLTGSNLVEVAPTIALSPLRGVKLLGEYAFAWRADTDDAVYRANGRPQTGTELSSAAKTAELARMQLTWAVSPRVSITSRYEHVFAGPGLEQAGYSDTDFFTAWISFHF